MAEPKERPRPGHSAGAGGEPLATADRVGRWLPRPLSPLVGRQEELATVLWLLAEHRLVCLTGSGGVGKTRLAVAAAEHLLATSPHGVCWADLASTTEAVAVGSVLLAACGTSEVAGHSPLVALERHLREESHLLVLDNCEHLTDELAAVTDALLQRCPRLRVLATSREPLGVPGEVVWRVPSMAVPPSDPAAWSQASQDEFDRAETFDAVQLFVERATRVRNDFRLDRHTVAPVVTICRRLDGIPLAIELAAARCRHLSPERIAAELDQRFRLLTGGASTVLARQQTLLASVRWSYDRLDEREQTVLRRLAVFAGPFPLAAAEAIASGSGDLDRFDVVNITSRLVDRNLVVLDSSHQPDTYRMLETIRQFASDESAAAGELDSFRDAHADWWIGWLEDLNACDPTDAVLELVRVYYENCRAAFEWRVSDPKATARLMSQLWMFWTEMRSDDAAVLGTRAIAAASDSGLEWAVLTMYRSFIVAITGAAPIPPDAMRAFDVVAECGRPLDRANGWRMRWNMLQGMDPDRLWPTLLEVRRCGHRTATAALEMTGSVTELLSGRADRATALLDGVDAGRLRQIGDSVEHVRVMHWLALGSGDPLAAVDHLERSPWVGNPMVNSMLATSLAHAALLTARRDVLDRSVDYLERCERRTPMAASFLACARSFVAMADDGAVVLPDPATLFTSVPLIHLEQTAMLGRAGLHAGQPGPTAAWIDGLTRQRPESYLATVGLVLRAAASEPSVPAVTDQAWRAALRSAASGPFPLLVADALAGLAHLAAMEGRDDDRALLLAAADAITVATGVTVHFDPWRRWRADDDRIVLSRDTRNSPTARAATAISARDWRAVVAWVERGRGPRTRPIYGWDGLTPTERMVADLAAEGLSNPAIAERLFIGRATVKSHLEHVYAKLGVRNRAELAGFVARLEH